MYNHSTVLVTAGSLCLIITLVLAWCLACVRTSAFMKRLFPNYQSLLNAHMDYLLMTGLLMIFYLLFAAFHVSAPPVILAAMCLGSLGNPVGVLVLAVKPGLRQHPTSPFGAAMTVSFALTCSDYSRLGRRGLVRRPRGTASSAMSCTEQSRQIAKRLRRTIVVRDTG